MFRLCLTYVSTVIDLRLDFLGRNWVCFDFLDLCFDFLGRNRVFFNCARLMFRPCSTYVSTFSAETGYVSTVLDSCFDRARPMFRLCSTYVSTFSTKIGYVSTKKLTESNINLIFVPTFDKKITEYLCSGGFLFLQTNIDFLTSHF